MILIERWVDILSILVIGAGIVGLLYLIRSRPRTTQRLLSEKPALFLEFTGKQMFVRQRRSKLLPSFREANLFDAVEPQATIPLIERIKDDFAVVSKECRDAIRDSLKRLRQYGEQCRVRISAVKKQSTASRARVARAIRTRLTRAGRATGAIRAHLTGPIRAHLTGARRKSSSRHAGRAVNRFQEVLMDLRVSLDFHGYRLVRTAQTKWRRIRTVAQRFAYSQTTYKYPGLVSIKSSIKRIWRTVYHRLRIQVWPQKDVGVLLGRYRHDLMAGYGTLQEIARTHVRRLRNHERYNGKKYPTPARTAAETDPLTIGLTSAGTLKLKNRLEDDGASSSEQVMGGPRKASHVPTPVSVRFVGPTPRTYKDSPQTKSAEQMVKR
jgi:hypothetical protein